MSALDSLISELANWCASNNFAPGCALEIYQSHEGLTIEQRLWLESYLLRWDAAEAVVAAGGRIAAWKRVYQHTHPDFRGCFPDGSLSIMSWAKYGGGLVTAETITDAELAERIGSARR